MTFDLQTTLIAIGAGLAVVILLWVMLRARIGRQRLRREEAPAAVERAADPYAVSKERPYMKATAPPAPTPAPAPAPPAPQDTPVTPPQQDEPIAPAPVDVAPAAGLVDDMAGIAPPPGTSDRGDDLTRLKGVGPKMAALLNDRGISRLSQIAALSDDEVAALDETLGAFKGRLTRDRVAEQARLLASGDREAYEAAFGKLGG